MALPFLFLDVLLTHKVITDNDKLSSIFTAGFISIYESRHNIRTQFSTWCRLSVSQFLS